MGTTGLDSQSTRLTMSLFTRHRWAFSGTLDREFFDSEQDFDTSFEAVWESDGVLTNQGYIHSASKFAF